MMALVVLLVFAGALLGWAILRAFLPMVSEAGTMSRHNYRGISVPIVGGIPIAVAVVLGLALIELLWNVVDGPLLPENSTGLVLPMAAMILATALFGLVDDAFGTPAAKGIRGHVKALLAGRLTSGMVKLVTGVLVAVAVAAIVEDEMGWIIVGALTIAAWTNVGNLLDLGPGRAIKGCVPIILVLILIYPEQTAPMALIVGVALGVLSADLRERVMLGDCGANPLGALVGLTAVACGERGVLLATLVVGLGLNLAAETVSFSQIIKSNRLLRWFDLIGVTPERREFIAGK